MSETPNRSSTTRVTRQRLDVTVVAAVLVPLLAVGASLLVDADPGSPGSSSGSDGGRAAAETALTEASVVCPGGGGDVLVTSTSGASGTVEARSRGRDADVEVGPGRTGTADLGDGPVVITGRDDLAPGLVAGRFSRPLASFDCRAPVFDQWFTAVGAGAKHRSILQLVNPDEGRAVVDVTVLGADGAVDAPLTGITGEGGASRTVDLAEVLPRRDELALRVSVVRGRVAASVRDTFRGLGRGLRGDDGLASQVAPSRDNLLLGLPPAGQGPRSVVIANPGDSQGRATLALVTEGSTFTPAGLEPVDLPPRSAVVVPMAKVLATAAEDDDDQPPLALRVTSTVAATATFSMFIDDDLATTVPAVPLAGPGTALLPAGDKRLVLGDARGPGVVTVVALDADGEQLDEQRVEVAPGRASTLDLPADARQVTVTPARTTVAGVVQVVSDEGATVVRLREPVSTGVVPDVRVGAP